MAVTKERKCRSTCRLLFRVFLMTVGHDMSGMDRPVVDLFATRLNKNICIFLGPSHGMEGGCFSTFVGSSESAHLPTVCPDPESLKPPLASLGVVSHSTVVGGGQAVASSNGMEPSWAAAILLIPSCPHHPEPSCLEVNK